MEYFLTFNSYLKRLYNKKIWRISLSTGYPCPNRINGRTGCTFCDGESFLPDYLKNNSDPIEIQLKKGMEFFGNKNKIQYFYGYFQENTNTYGPVNELIRMYEYILSKNNIFGLIISTRPDCIYKEIIEKLAQLQKKYNKEIWVELGLQSVYNETLKNINRNHTYDDFKNAVKIIKDNSTVKIGVHMIIGLPGEPLSLIEKGISTLFLENSIDAVKFRILEILPGTKLSEEYKKNPSTFYKFKIHEYCQLLCNIIEKIPKNVIIMKLVNNNSLKNFLDNKKIHSTAQFINLINDELKKRGTNQGYYHL